MGHNPPFDESAFHLRRGFKLAIAVLIVCAGALLAQDLLPSAARDSTPKASAAASVRVGSWATPVDRFSLQSAPGAARR